MTNEKSNFLAYWIGFLLASLIFFLLIWSQKGQAQMTTEAEKIEADHLALQEAQANTMEEIGHYQHVPEFTIGANRYSVTEYVTPKGETGLQTFVFTPDTIYSKGTGPEAEDRTYEIPIHYTNTECVLFNQCTDSKSE